MCEVKKFELSLQPHRSGGGIGRHAGLKRSGSKTDITECLKGNFESRTPLTNGNLARRNAGFGDGSLNSAQADKWRRDYTGRA